MDSQTDCFLCEPDADLVYSADGHNVALCGLGPLVSGYSVVASRRHIRSCADAAVRNKSLIRFAERIRRMLALQYGSCLLTEHGRMQVCRSTSAADAHCYHAHFLLFPGAPPVEVQARSHFATVSTYRTLQDALSAARMEKEYFLFSPKPGQFFIMSRRGRLIRQFARLLVAEAIGLPRTADWARFPNRDQAAATATSLRALIPLEKRVLWDEKK